MKIRKMDADGDMTFGHGSANFYRNQPDGVAQLCLTRMRMQLGEWFLDTTDGTPWKTQVLGKRTNASRDPALRARAAGTEGVTRIVSYASQMNRETREFSAQITIDTKYGTATVAGPV